MKEDDKVATEVATLFFKVFGTELDMESFTDRILLQKIVYLADKLGIKTKDFDFNLYVYGPYSPELTTIGYRIYNKANGIKVEESLYTDTEISRLKQVFLPDEIKSKDTRQAELLASVLYAIKEKQRTTDEEILDFITQKKPGFGGKEIQEATQRIKQHYSS